MSVKLRNGVVMPALAVATYYDDIEPALLIPSEMQPPSINALDVDKAVEAGYRHFDFSMASLRNLEEVLQALQNSIEQKKVCREELFLSCKVCPIWIEQEDGTFDYDEETFETPHDKLAQYLENKVVQEITGALERANFDQFDLVILQSAGDPRSKVAEDNREFLICGWRALQCLYNKKLARAIGTCNWNEDQLYSLLREDFQHHPMINQIHGSIYSRYLFVEKICQQFGIPIAAHSPFGFIYREIDPKDDKKLDVAFDEIVVCMAEEYDKTPEELAIKYLMQEDYAGLLLPLASVVSNKILGRDLLKSVALWKISDDDKELLTTQNLKTQTWTWSEVTNCVAPNYLDLVDKSCLKKKQDTNVKDDN
jgi:D-xylose reductase